MLTQKLLSAFTRGLLAVAAGFLMAGTLVAAAQAPSAGPIRVIPLPTSLAHGNAPITPPTLAAQPRAGAFGERLAGKLTQLRAKQAVALSGGASRARGVSAAVESGADARKPDAGSTLDKLRPGVQAALPAAPGAADTPRVSMKRDGSLRRVRSEAGRTLQARAGGSEETVRTYLRSKRGLFGLANPDVEVTLRTEQADSLGHHHLRFRQTYRGLNVFGAELVAQLDRSGNLVSVHGGYTPTPRKLATRPAIARADADRLVSGRYPRGTLRGEAPELLVYVPEDGTPVLGWKYEVSISLQEERLVIVDAHRGTIVCDFNRVHAARVAGSGTDLFGQTRPLNVWQQGSAYYLVDTSKPMFDASSTPPSLQTGRGMIAVADMAHAADGPLSPVTSGGGPAGAWLRDGVSAAVNFSATYDYYRTEHGLNSVDGHGANILAVVRYRTNYANAFWSQALQGMVFGDAVAFAGAEDVVGHELTHGVIEHSAGLIYQGQSGALNESFADIFGELIERYATGTNDWKLGTRVGVIRDMANPAALEYAPGKRYPTRMSEFVQLPSDDAHDSGGVHTNSSITNRAFYLLAAGLPNAVGPSTAGKIFFRALTTKLTPQSDFVDARLAAVDSAEELFGAGSAQVAVVNAAFDAVEIFEVVNNPAPAPYPGTTGPDATVLVFKDATSQRFYLGRKETALGDAAQGAVLSVNPVARSKPAVTGDGAMVGFVNSQNDFCLILSLGGAPEECLGFPGFVHSVAMSPDGKTYAFVFLDAAGEPDDRINVIDSASGQAQAYALIAPATDGATGTAVLEADAMDFTADGRFLVYDAFNLLTLTDGSRVGLWSIYAIDRATGATLVVVPPTQGYDIGFPSVAQTSDTHMVIDARSQQTGQNTVLAVDLQTGRSAAVATIGGYGVPGYTGDDRAIVYSKPGTSPTGSSLYRRALLANRVDPDPAGGEALWVSDADYGVVYRRGAFAGPGVVDLRVTQTVATLAPHRAQFNIQVTNTGPGTASSIQLSDVLPANAEFVGATGGATCTAASGNQVSCSIPDIAAGVSAALRIELRARAAGSVQNSVTVFGGQTDTDPSTNTSFSVAAATALNAVPAASGTIPAQTATEGTAFSVAMAGRFTDSDGDPLSFSASGLPAGLSINSGSGTISGTPGAGTAATGPYSVQVTATDSFGASASGTFSLVVNAGSGGGGGGSGGSGGGGGGAIDLVFLLGVLGTIGVIMGSGRRP